CQPPTNRHLSPCAATPATSSTRSLAEQRPSRFLHGGIIYEHPSSCFHCIRSLIRHTSGRRFQQAAGELAGGSTAEYWYRALGQVQRRFHCFLRRLRGVMRKSAVVE